MLKQVILFLLLLTVIRTSPIDEDDLCNKVMEFITKQGFKVLVSPKFLKAEIMIILGRVVPKALARTALKDLPVLGIFTGIGFGAWRFINGQWGRGIAEIASGAAGATGSFSCNRYRNISLRCCKLIIGSKTNFEMIDRKR